MFIYPGLTFTMISLTYISGIFSLFLGGGHAVWLEKSQFPNQGLIPDPLL